MNRRGIEREAIIYTLLAIAGIILIIVLVKKYIITPNAFPAPDPDELAEVPVIVGAFLASRRAKHHNF